jgi:hypothetical protein
LSLHMADSTTLEFSQIDRYDCMGCGVSLLKHCNTQLNKHRGRAPAACELMLFHTGASVCFLPPRSELGCLQQYVSRSGLKVHRPAFPHNILFKVAVVADIAGRDLS